MPDPKWESIEGRIDTNDDGSKTVTLEVRPEGFVVGYRMDVDPRNVPIIGKVIDTMVQKIDEALHA